MVDRSAELKGRAEWIRLALIAAVSLVGSAAVAMWARQEVATASPDFDAILGGGCTAGRLPGAPWTGGVGAWILVVLAASLAASSVRRQWTALALGLCGPLVLASVEGWMSLSAATLEVAALVAFVHERRGWSWGLAVVATWVWPPAGLGLIAVAVGEVDDARRRGEKGLAPFLLPASALAFAAAAAVPAWVLRADAFLPVLAQRGFEGVAVAAASWIESWPREATLAALVSPTSANPWTQVLKAGGLVTAGFVFTLGLISLLRRAPAHRHYAGQRLLLGLGLWSLVLTGALGLGRGSWGSTQALLHVAVALLLVEGGVELAARPKWRWVAGVGALLLALGWTAGLHHVAREWAMTSPFLH